MDIPSNFFTLLIFSALFGTAESCGESLFGQDGNISSPNYPSSYSHNLNCECTINGTPESTIVLQFTKFDVVCPGDYVTMYNGNISLNDTLLHEKCGISIQDEIGVLNSSASVVVVKFISDSSGRSTGFFLTWRVMTTEREQTTELQNTSVTATTAVASTTSQVISTSDAVASTTSQVISTSGVPSTTGQMQSSSTSSATSTAGQVQSSSISSVTTTTGQVQTSSIPSASQTTSIDTSSPTSDAAEDSTPPTSSALGIPVIAGAAGGGGFVLIIVIIVIVVCCVQRSKPQNSKAKKKEYDSLHMEGGMVSLDNVNTEKTGVKPSPSSDPNVKHASYTEINIDGRNPRIGDQADKTINAKEFNNGAPASNDSEEKRPEVGSTKGTHNTSEKSSSQKDDKRDNMQGHAKNPQDNLYSVVNKDLKSVKGKGNGSGNSNSKDGMKKDEPVPVTDIYSVPDKRFKEVDSIYQGTEEGEYDVLHQSRRKMPKEDEGLYDVSVPDDNPYDTAGQIKSDDTDDTYDHAKAFPEPDHTYDTASNVKSS